VCARGKTVLVTPSAELTVGGHAAVETFPEAARLAAVATVTPDGTVAGVLTRVRAATQTLLILHRTPEETLKTHVVKNVFIPAIISYLVLNSGPSLRLSSGCAILATQNFFSID